jgi:hypothetical protein
MVCERKKIEVKKIGCIDARCTLLLCESLQGKLNNKKEKKTRSIPVVDVQSKVVVFPELFQNLAVCVFLRR